jgi:hypothetical protein
LRRREVTGVGAQFRRGGEGIVDVEITHGHHACAKGPGDVTARLTTQVRRPG